MSKLTAATRYMLVALLAAAVLAVIGILIISPAEWRGHLLNLLSRSLTTFSAGNRSGWLVSHVYAPVFLLVANLAVVGIMQGGPAVRRQRIQTSAIAFVSLLAQMVLFYGALYLREVARTVYEDHRLLASTNIRLTRERANLAPEMSLWKTRALNAEIDRAQSPAAIALEESAKKIEREARSQASDALQFQEQELGHTPTVVFGGPAEITRKTMEDANRYNQQAIVDFLKKFGGPIESVMRRGRRYGVDPSRLQRHIMELNSIPMMQLVANDLNDIGDQLHQGTLVGSERRAARAY
jgi:hypothetical protein